MWNILSRRGFLGSSAAGLTLAARAAAPTARPALLGGEPVRKAAFPAWPVFDQSEENALHGVLRSMHWFRGSGKSVQEFETRFAERMGVRHVLATANGTSALFTVLKALGVGPGDEVIVPPYTFVATINVVLLCHALPVFVDTDPETFQIDARKIEAALTPQTAALMPVHLGGAAADLDAILPLAAARKLPVIEDACQSHFAEWRGKKLGALGTAGCFSFQASKNLNSGEGGAILTNDPALVEACYTFHNNSRSRVASGYTFTYGSSGANLRLTEFQGSLLLAQMARTEQQTRRREENAQYLTSMLQEVPGLLPAKMYPGNNRNAYHLYMFRYRPESFAGLPHERFIKALRAEGIPCSAGYGPLNKEPFLTNTLAGKGYQRIYSAERLRRWKEQNQCPANDRLCREAVWLTQNMLLGPRSDMEHIAAAVRKIQHNAADLARS
jgi:dTDP-4-amino-4,6-dideoxygalactose transaminase